MTMTESLSPQPTVRTRATGQTPVVAIEGDFDLAAVPAFTAEVHGLLELGTTSIEVDASEATFADSSALMALLVAQRDAETAGAELYVAATSPPLDRVLEMTGLSRALCRTT
jgi:anti-anti-sigma factor